MAQFFTTFLPTDYSYLSFINTQADISRDHKNLTQSFDKLRVLIGPNSNQSIVSNIYIFNTFTFISISFSYLLIYILFLFHILLSIAK